MRFILSLLLGLILNPMTEADTLEDINAGEPPAAYNGDESGRQEVEEFERQEQEAIELEEDGSFEEEIGGKNSDDEIIKEDGSLGTFRIQTEQDLERGQKLEQQKQERRAKKRSSSKTDS